MQKTNSVPRFKEGSVAIVKFTNEYRADRKKEMLANYIKVKRSV